MDDIKTFQNLILEIIKRPAMFSINKVEDVKLFCSGYQFALNDDQKIILQDFIDGFKKFVNEYFENTIDSGWDKLIRYNSSSDIHSMELFKYLFSSFLTNSEL